MAQRYDFDVGFSLLKALWLVNIMKDTLMVEYGGGGGRILRANRVPNE